MPPAPEQRALQAMVRHLQAVKAMRQQERNRLTSGVSAEAVVHALQQHIAFLDGQIADLEQQIRDHIDQYPHLKQQRDLLGTIPGLGDSTIATLLGEVADILAFDSAAQFAAYAGVTPRQFRSARRFAGVPAFLNAATLTCALPSISRRWSLYAIIQLCVPSVSACAPTDCRLKRWSSQPSASCSTSSTVFLSPVVRLTQISQFKQLLLDF